MAVNDERARTSRPAATQSQAGRPVPEKFRNYGPDPGLESILRVTARSWLFTSGLA
jgi:hypothetical protein